MPDGGGNGLDMPVPSEIIRRTDQLSAVGSANEDPRIAKIYQAKSE